MQATTAFLPYTWRGLPLVAVSLQRDFPENWQIGIRTVIKMCSEMLISYHDCCCQPSITIGFSKRLLAYGPLTQEKSNFQDILVIEHPLSASTEVVW